MNRLTTRPECEAQGESGGHQSPSTAGAALRDAVPHHRRNPPTVDAWLHAGRVMFLGKLGSTASAPKSYDGSMVVGKEFGGRLTQPTPGAAAMLYHYRQNALTLIAGARRVTCFRQRCAQRAPAWLAETDAEDAVSVEVQPWASSGPILGKGAATGESTAKSPSAGVQPWAMETKVLRRKYSRGQWRPKPCSGSTAVGNGDPSPAAGVQSWAKEIKALRRKYRRGQWRRPKVLRSEHDRGQGFTAASEAPR